MYYRVCGCCGGHVDAGELVNGICEECRREQEKRKDASCRMELLVRSTDYKQIEMEDLLSGKFEYGADCRG